MGIKITKKEVKLLAPERKKSPEKEVKEVKTSKLPSGAYSDEIEPFELVLNETNKLVFSVKRAGEFGLPHVDIRHYVTSERYEGFTKKGINFPLELLYDFIDTCNGVNDACDEKGLE